MQIDIDKAIAVMKAEGMFGSPEAEADMRLALEHVLDADVLGMATWMYGEFFGVRPSAFFSRAATRVLAHGFILGLRHSRAGTTPALPPAEAPKTDPLDSFQNFVDNLDLDGLGEED